MSVLVNSPIDSKLDMLANALETKLKLKMTLTIGRRGKIEKGRNSIARKIAGGNINMLHCFIKFIKWKKIKAVGPRWYCQ